MIFFMSEPISTLVVLEATGLRTPSPVDKAETLALVFEDDQGPCGHLYYTAYEIGANHHQLLKD